MEAKELQKQIVDLLIENEKAMQSLYRTYSKKFPLFESFWMDISNEEEGHAAWIGTLYDKMKAGMMELPESRFPVDAIRSNIEYIRNREIEANHEQIELVASLESAVHIERNMLEHRFFEVFQGDTLELQILLEALRLSTEEHLRKVENELTKEKFGSDFESRKS